MKPMKLSSSKVLVTGGAGFVGSHLVDSLCGKVERIVVLDNLSSGSLNNLKSALTRESVQFMKADLTRPEQIPQAVDGCDIVFHLAANPEVRAAISDTKVDFQQNLLATYNLLEAIRKGGNPVMVVLASTSTVYGEPRAIPTPEDYAPLIPISLYGATKLSCESLLASYTHLFGLKGLVYRFANVVGSRSRHGVIYDFIGKLRRNPKELEILGDGSQSKSYLHISDCVDAFLYPLEILENAFDVFNIGNADRIDVTTIAETVCKEMDLEKIRFHYVPGPAGRGWPGDVKIMQLSTKKIMGLGWNPKLGSLHAVKKAAKELLAEI